MLKRFLDIFLVLIALVWAIPVLVITGLAIKLTSKGPVLYWSQRVGQHNQLFSMPKLRSMRMHTPALATHIMNQQNNPSQYLTPIGSFIRKTSLDELPQLWSVLKGDMSIVGPRPALYNQDDLVQLRTEHGVDALKPGVTGWAQINGRDEIPIPQKVALDTYYLEHQSLGLDCLIIWRTLIKVITRADVSH